MGILSQFVASTSNITMKAVVGFALVVCASAQVFPVPPMFAVKDSKNASGSLVNNTVANFTPLLMAGQASTPQVGAAFEKAVPLISAWNDDMMSYYYLWITGINIAMKVKNAGGFGYSKPDWAKVPELAKKGDAAAATISTLASMSLERDPVKEGMKLFKKPFEAFKAKIERELQHAVENDADDENTDDLEESFLEKEGKDAISAAASAITLKAADPVAVFTTWLDLCANWHIISNVYIGLYMNLKALKTSKSYKTFLAIWTSFAALHWQFTFIYKDFLNIWNQYRKIEWLPKYEMWFTRVMHVWVSLQQWCGVVDLYVLAAGGKLVGSKAGFAWQGAIQTIDNMRSLQNILATRYISEFKSPATKVFDIADFLLMDFAIKVLYTSGTTRAKIFLAK